MDLNKSKPGVAWLFMAYNVVLAGVWVMRAAHLSVTPFMVFLHVGLAFLFLEIPNMVDVTRLRWKILAGFYPFVLWSLAWSEIGWLYNLTQPAVFDGTIRALDLSMFGSHLNDHFAILFSWGVLRDFMGFSYLSYYLLILGPPLALALRRREKALSNHTFALITTYLVCFVIYLVLPVLGPRDLAHAAGETARGVGGIFGPVINAFFEAGDSLGTAFPSSHCAGSLASALLVRRYFRGAVGWAALVWAGFIILSTVYTNNHYAIDAVAGVLTALLIHKLVFVYLERPAGAMMIPTRSLAGKGLGMSRRIRPEGKGELS